MESFRKYINLNEYFGLGLGQPLRSWRSVDVAQDDGTTRTVTFGTQHHAEASLITHGSKPTKSGSTLPDLEVHFGDGSKVNAEVKSGRNIDIAQMAVNIDPESNDVSFSGSTAKKAKAGLEAHGVAQRIMKHLGRRVADNHHKEASALSSQHHDFLTDKHKEYTESHFETARRAHAAGNIGQEFNEKDALKSAKAASIEQIKRDHPEESKYVHTSSKEVKPLTAMGSSLAHMLNSPEGGGEIRRKMDNRMVHDFMHNYEDPIQKHIHQGTGEIAVFPVSNEHRKHTDQMGLKGQVSLEDIVNHKDERKNSLRVSARLRRKETRGSLSVAGDSSHFVDAVKRHGGTVFADADEYKAHAEKHGFQVRSGQFPNEPKEDAPVSEQTIVEGLATALGSSIMSNILDPDKAKEREETRKKAETAKTTPAATTDTQTTDTQTTYTQPADPLSAPPWPGGKDGAPPPVWGGNEEDNPYKDWNQDDSGKWVKMPASAAPEPTGTETPVPDFSFTPQEKDPSGGLRNRPAERQSEDSTKTGQQHIGFQPEGIEKMFSDFIKEKHLELGAVGMLGGPILKDPKKKKVEESAMLMMMPLLYKMQNESRNTINNITHSQGNPDER